MKWGKWKWEVGGGWEVGGRWVGGGWEVGGREVGWEVGGGRWEVGDGRWEVRGERVGVGGRWGRWEAGRCRAQGGRVGGAVWCGPKFFGSIRERAVRYDTR